jgi:hypothetical protein
VSVSIYDLLRDAEKCVSPNAGASIYTQLMTHLTIVMTILQKTDLIIYSHDE